MPDATVGSTLYKATELCERALRKIGAYGINDDAPAEEDLYEALYWLDMGIAFVSGIDRCFWLVADELEIDLAEDTASYVLATELATQLKNGVQFPVSVQLEDANGNRCDLEIVSREKFEKIRKPTITRAGTPRVVFIDRLNGPTLRTYPVPTATDVGSKLILTVQGFATSVKPMGKPGGQVRLTSETTGFRAAWNLYIVTLLATLIGDGPVRALPRDRIAGWKQDVGALKQRLDAFENREHDNEPPYVASSVYQ